VPLLILVVTLLGIRFPLSLLLLDRWHADAIWWSFPLSSLVAVLLAMLYYKFGGWRRMRMITPTAAAGRTRADIGAA
jgi:Na+-driven multidrug efflux pump